MPRIALIHGIREAQRPAWEAFSDEWPEAQLFNLLDDSLSADLLTDGTLTESLSGRIISLAHYAAATFTSTGRTEGIVFTCSPFGPAIRQAKAQLDIPVLLATEAALELALDSGSAIGLLAATDIALPSLAADLHAMADDRGISATTKLIVVEEALGPLKAGDTAEYYRLIAKAAEKIRDVDVLVLTQFSMAPAARLIPYMDGRQVLTSPSAAVRKIRLLLDRDAVV